MRNHSTSQGSSAGASAAQISCVATKQAKVVRIVEIGRTQTFAARVLPQSGVLLASDTYGYLYAFTRSGEKRLLWYPRCGGSTTRIAAAGNDSAELFEAALLDALARRRDAELERGVCLVGPHRDDLEVQAGRAGRASGSYRVECEGGEPIEGRIVLGMVRDGGEPRIGLIAVTPRS